MSESTLLLAQAKTAPDHPFATVLRWNPPSSLSLVLKLSSTLASLIPKFPLSSAQDCLAVFKLCNFFKIGVYLFTFGCAGSSLLHPGFV